MISLQSPAHPTLSDLLNDPCCNLDILLQNKCSIYINTIISHHYKLKRGADIS